MMLSPTREEHAMPEQEFEGDLTGAVFWGADLSGATFRDVNLTGARVSHTWLVDVEIDALVDRVTINGVDVTDFVNQHDAWYPLRTMLRPDDVAGMRRALDALEATWATTMATARALPEAKLHESVNGEFSFVQTLRHLVMAIDKWFTAPILGAPFDPIGLPNRGSMDFAWPGLDYDLDPTFAEVLAVRADRAGRLHKYLDALQPGELDREVVVLENGPSPTRECIYTVFEEEFHHNRYALRDLALLR
jgi:hypothetical protein